MTLETLKASGLISKLSVDVKVLGDGELTKKLSVTAHTFSKTAVEKIEAAGGSVMRLREPVVRKRKRHKVSAPVADEPEETTADETASDESEESAPEEDAAE